MFINQLFSGVLILTLLPTWLGFATVSRPRIDSPKSGEALQGVISITGSTNVAGFQSSDISFSYDRPDNSDWFPIQQSNEPVDSDILATWDTTTIADDTYRLRVSVTLKDGTNLETIVNGLRVRNYSALETSTPSPTKSTAGTNNSGSGVASSTSIPTPTDLASNPAGVSPSVLTSSAFSGALVAGIAFAMFGFYLGYRRLFKHR
jgi:hypothetical protein